MSKWFNKQTIISFILGLCVMSSIPTYAAVKMIQAKVTTIKLQVNNKLIDTSKTPTLNYNNTNYISARTLTEALDGDIAMDSKTNTLIINSNKKESVGEEENLLDITEASTIPSINNTQNTKTTINGFSAIENNGNYYISIQDFNKKWEPKDKYNYVQYALKIKDENGNDIFDKCDLICSTYKTSIKVIDEFGVKFKSTNPEFENKTVLTDIPVFCFDNKNYIDYNNYVTNICPLLKL